ncbi:MAG: hypothetical protein JSU61_08695 [Fidelibacterota bacterium]|nr:MAG: hypothetical protein JSU61_08695 [Candidatus Neomarinimicrobiota bacterium]
MRHPQLRVASILILAATAIASTFLSCTKAEKDYIQGIPVVASYGYNLSGRTDRIKGYLFKIENMSKVHDPCLMFIAKGVDGEDEAYLMVNSTRYQFPPLIAGSKLKTELPSDQEMGKRGFYALSHRDDLLGKIVVPLKTEDLQEGINEVTFYKGDQGDGYKVMDSRIESAEYPSAEVVGITYRIIARGRPASVADFDYVMNYKGEDKRKETDVPEWARRGKVHFYRAGIDYEHLDRMFEMFEEARINLIAVHVPPDEKSDDYARVKALIDRCHENGIMVTAFFSLGGIRLSNVMMNPDLIKYVSRDEYGDLRWREHGRTYLADLTNKGYMREQLDHVRAAVRAGVDEIYYDYAIGGTGEVIDFMSKIRGVLKEEGRNLTIYGNCKGDILVDDLCDLTKSEGTEEAGIFDGEWVHNVTQSRFYYAAGDGWKPYRSKYEGADPGVAHPGAYDIREGMKYGWRRPIAEASAFQSHFAIAETGSKLRNGWIHQDNELAMEIWKGIASYFQFLEKYEDYYTDVRTVSEVGLLAPPVIPSFEVALTRIPLFDAMAELNVMYDILLLPRMNADLVNRYSAIVIPDIPYIEEEQLKVLEAYKKSGGRVYTIGSCDELRALADTYSPSSLIQEIGRKTRRDEFSRRLHELSGAPLVSIPDAPYVLANVVKKLGSEQVILHLVNYSEPVENMKVRVNLEGVVDSIDRDSIILLSPDAVPQEVKVVSIRGAELELTIPRLEMYDIVAIN